MDKSATTKQRRPWLTAMIIAAAWPFAASIAGIAGLIVVAPISEIIGRHIPAIDDQSSLYCNQTAEFIRPIVAAPLGVTLFMLACLVPMFRRAVGRANPAVVGLLVWALCILAGLWLYCLDTHDPSLCPHLAV